MNGRAVLGGVLLLASAGCAANAPSPLVTVHAVTCGTAANGIGVVLADGTVLTAAHPLAGADPISVDGRYGRSAATVVGFDPDHDLARLSPEHPVGSTLRLATSEQVDELQARADRSADGVDALLYVRRDGRFERLPATVLRAVNINTEDIYVDRDVTRPGWELRADIQPGDSGAPVIVDGVVVGVVWARSNLTEQRAWAIDPVRGGGLLDEQLRTGTITADLTRCF